ncbi:MAG: radical SAM protein, partial [Candidatus Woesearchaeota archaeon]
MKKEPQTIKKGIQSMNKETQDLIKLASKTFKENFPMQASFERAIFFSWGCTIGDCTFCYMSTQPKEKAVKETRRSTASILAEFILSKHLGWDIGFFTGGIGIFTPQEIKFLLQAAHQIIGEKIWLSIGPVPKKLLEEYLPYIKGVVGSTETVNPKLHKKICPSKPLKPYEIMFESATDLGLMKAMTFIVGMGETKDDFILLKEFIEKYKIDKIHVYGLIPQEGTVFENSKPPSAEEQAWWIAKLRITFPKLDIQCGIWEDRIERISLLLKAGSNSISKYKATKLFGTKISHAIENEVKKSGREFKGTLTKLPDIDWNKEVDKLNLEHQLKEEIKAKLEPYLKRMKANQINNS